MSTLKQQHFAPSEGHFAPSEGTCYNPSTGMECTTTKSGKYSAKDWKKGSNVKYGKNDGKRMSEEERFMIKALLSHLYLNGTETDGELIHLADENNIDINNPIRRSHAKGMLKKVKRAYNRSKRFVDAHKYDYLPNCTFRELKDNLDSLSEDPSASDFDTWIGYAKSFVKHEKRIHNELTQPLRFDNKGGWRPREGDVGESESVCTIT